MREIKIEGFVSNIRDTVDETIAAGIYGPEGSGKTRLLTTAPDPIGIVPLDRKTRWTVAKVMEEQGKTVLMPKEDFIRHAKPLELLSMGEVASKKYYLEHVKRVMDAAYTLLVHKDIRTVAVDSGSQLWEDILFKNFGRNQRIMPRDRGPSNQDMIDFLNAMTGKHFIITFKAKEKWKTITNQKTGEQEDKPSGEFEMAGFNGSGYHLTVVCEMKRNLLYNTENGKGGGKDWQFSLNVKMCQANALIQGPQGQDLLTDDMISFQQLACQIYPNADPQDFI